MIRLRTITLPGALAGVALALHLAGAGSASSAPRFLGAVHDQSLVALYHESPVPNEWRGWQSGSQVVSLPVAFPNGDPWNFWITYRGCQPTAHGALRVSVYAPEGSGALRLYSNTVVERKSSGTHMYGFATNSQLDDYYLRVQIPSHAECAWRLGSEGN